MENINFTFPIDLIKKEERIVVGIATADNIDKAGDVVDFSASVEAFKNWQGNIREMHAPIAVGKAIKYEPVKIKGENGQEYNAMKVEAYISKGAQDTWEKILDGTLRSFSIGGRILKKELDTQKIFRGKPVNIIKEYELGELSLVDNPANPAAVIDIIKFDTSNNLDYILKIDCSDIDLTIPESVRRMAEVGLRQRKEHGRGGTSVGLGSARRLAAGGKASPEFVRKVARYFPRHAVDLKANGANPGDDGYPSNGRIAWNLWGGTPGWTWARSKVRQLDNCTKKGDFEFDFEKNIYSCCDDCDNYDIMSDTDEIEKVLKYMEYEDFIEIMNLEKEAKTKRENGIDFPASAFAYVPDPQTPSTWKLRLWENLDSKETAAQVGRAVAAIGKGFRGNVVEIPEADMSSVKAKIKAAWRKTNKDKDMSEMPDVLKFDHNEVSLQNDNIYDTVTGMDASVDQKLSLLKRFINWLIEPADKETDVQKSVDTLASTDLNVEAENDQMEDQMDIDMLKDALGSVIDQKLTDFAASLKEEVEASVNEKIEEVTKSVAAEKEELTEKLNAAEKALEEQSTKVEELASAGAMRKSVDPDGDEDGDEELVKSNKEQSFWNNIYLPSGLVKTLGYDS